MKKSITIIVYFGIVFSIGYYFNNLSRSENNEINRSTKQITPEPQRNASKPKLKTLKITRTTTYNPEKSQCEGNPLRTADGSIINLQDLENQKIRWCAISRDLIYNEYRQTLFSDTTHWRGLFEFGDTIYIESISIPHINGKWVVHDCMNPRYNNSVDLLFDKANNKPKLGVLVDLEVFIE